ncbi:MAG: DUF1330 domain-containing protein [Xanthobacteraceae bacterium]
MPKGYWLPQIDVSDPQGYQAYMAATPPALEKYRGFALVRGGKSELVKGQFRSRAVICRFPDYATALACVARTNISGRGRCGWRTRPVISSSSRAMTASSRRCRVHPCRLRQDKGYRIGHVDITDTEGYKEHMVADMVPFGKFGRRFLVRGGAREVTEGKVRSRTVVLEFPSYEAALARYRSPDYQAAKKLRDGRSQADLVIAEGYDGPKY